MSVPFMEALQRNDLAAAAKEAGAVVPVDMPEDLRNFLLFRLAQLAVDPSIHEWLGRLIVIEGPDGERRVIGSIGFHGPPDEAGRVEVGRATRRKPSPRYSTGRMVRTGSNASSLRYRRPTSRHCAWRRSSASSRWASRWTRSTDPSWSSKQPGRDQTRAPTRTLISRPSVSSAPARRVCRNANPTNHSGQPRAGYQAGGSVGLGSL
jgi:hypothetical protein